MSSHEEYITESSEHYYMQLVPPAVKLELRTRYAARGRFYHTWRHVREMFRGLELVDENLDCLGAVVLAVAFHDAVLNPRRTDNEYRSVALMRRLCPAKLVEPFWVERAETLIMATAAGHRLPVGHAAESDAGYFLDLDLAILGASPKRYSEYVQQVRQEYAFVSDPDWRAGRGRFVKATLDRAKSGSLFSTAWGQQNFAASAERNLREELANYAEYCDD